MKKIIPAIIALATALCSCTKDEIIDPVPQNPVLPESPLIFTASMENIPDSRVTLEDMIPNWEIGDQISINNIYYKAENSGTRATFIVMNEETEEIRPTYISTTTPDSYSNNPPSYLVDNAGTYTRWCAHTDHKVDGVWNIVVSTGIPTKLYSIKLWNADNTASYSKRTWKDIDVYGATSAGGPWGDPIKSFRNLNLEVNNAGLAGEIAINTTTEYAYYKINVLDNNGDGYMQMSDMKFVVSKSNWIRPAYVATTTPDSYSNNPPSYLVDAAGTSTRWCANTSHKVGGVWNIIVSTGTSSKLNSIKLWNAENQRYPKRRWKKLSISGSESSTGDDWSDIGTFDNLNLDVNNYGLAGEIKVNATQSYTFYKIDVEENEGDDYMQMSDMLFYIGENVPGPFDAYYPASLHTEGKSILPSDISEIWREGKFNMPMYAHSNNKHLSFKNLCGVLEIKVKSDQIQAVKRIRVSSNQSMSGTFNVQNNGAVIQEGTGPVTITYNEPVTTTEEGRSFYVAVPPQTYDYIKFELDADGEGFSKVLNTKEGKKILIERNRIYPISARYNPAVSVSLSDQISGQVKDNIIMKNTGSDNIYIRAMIIATWYDNNGNIVAPWDESQGTFETLAPAPWIKEDGIYYYNNAVGPQECPEVPIFTQYTKPVEAPVEGAHLEMTITIQAIPYDSAASCVDAFKRLVL